MSAKLGFLRKIGTGKKGKLVIEKLSYYELSESPKTCKRLHDG
jgi:hypothetical protein